MVYVFRNNAEDGQKLGKPRRLMPSYDGGSYAYGNMATFDPTNNPNIINPNEEAYQGFMSVFRAGAWVGYPLVAENGQLWGDSDSNGVTIQLRAASKYRPYSPSTDFVDATSIASGGQYYVSDGRVTVNQDFEVQSGDSTIIVQDSVRYYKGGAFKAVEAGFVSTSGAGLRMVETVNRGLPLYNFNTYKVAPTISDSLGTDALDEIKAVPNPYYAYSSYEEQRLDYVVKLINLPEVCTINIFTVNGTLVRTYDKDDPTATSIDWDLKNQDNITIASGLYIIHVEAPGLGEKILKWFGVLRPIDLNSF